MAGSYYSRESMPPFGRRGGFWSRLPGWRECAEGDRRDLGAQRQPGSDGQEPPLPGSVSGRPSHADPTGSGVER